MRKGDEKRQELLNTAERIFCQKGYEAASIQDILNAMGMSKGGFYHHFTGKEAVMHALCVRHAANACAAAQAALTEAVTPVERINAVLRSCMPFRLEEVSFLRALLPVVKKPEARALALSYQEAIVDAFLPLLQREVNLGVRAGVLFPPARDMEHAVLHLINRAFLDLAGYLAGRIETGTACDAPVLLHLLEKYRRAVEVLLDAPFGAVEIIRVEELSATAAAIMAE